MNIVVCVKYVPDAQSERSFNESDSATDRVGVDGLLSELDEYAEEALKIVEAGEGEVTVLTVRAGGRRGQEGPPDGCSQGGPRPGRGDPRLGLDRHVARPGRGDQEDRGRRPGPDRHGLDRRHHERRPDEGDGGTKLAEFLTAQKFV
jgi:hypothetical protein